MPNYVYIADSDVCVSAIQREHYFSGDCLAQQYDKRIIAANCAARIILYC
jgi:hypothetical protein